jgi:hypothetical protein
LNPACRRLWRRTKNDQRVLLHQWNLHPLQHRHLRPPNIFHLSLYYHHFHGFIADLGHVLNGIILTWTNVHCPFHEVQEEQDEPVLHITDADIPAHEIVPDLQVLLVQSLSDPPLHDVEMYYMDAPMNSLVMFQASIQLPFNLHLGTINIMIHSPTKRTTNSITVPTINIPPKSGNPGTNGRISPRDPTTLILQDGSTIQSHHTNINRTTILLPNPHQSLSLHFPPNTLHMATAITPVDLALSNPGPLPSLQDTLPSTSKRDPKRNGLDMFIMLCTIQTECVQRTSWRTMNVQNHPRPSFMLNMTLPWNRSIRSIREYHLT